MPRRVALSLALSLCCSCAGVTTVVVAPGHAAVVLTEDGHMGQLGEGASDVSGAVSVVDYDLRQQIQGGSFAVITADGVPLIARDPIVSYSLVPDELVAAERRVAPDGLQALITPIVHATIAGVIATYRLDDLTPQHIRDAQARITELAATRLRPLHVALSSVELKGLTPQLTGLARAVTGLSIWEQRSLEARTELDVARQRADGLRAQAAGIAAANRSIAPTLSTAVLDDKRNQAWQQLITSLSTTVEITPQPSPQLEVSP